MTNLKKNLEILADWWAEQITSGTWDNGDDSPTGRLAFLLANMLVERSRDAITPEMKEGFKNLFIDRAIAHYEGKGYLPEMSVDYYPSDFLAQVANGSGIPLSAFLCKSHSVIRDDKPFAKCGYGKPLIELNDTSTV